MLEKILEVKHVNAYYREGKTRRQILDDVSFTLYEGEIVGLVGESGSGKSTLCKCVLGLLKDYEGEIVHYTQRPQMVFQDPFSALNPRKTIGWILEEPLRVKGGFSRQERRKEAVEMLQRVHLPEDFYERYPRELSGGQRQRVSIALALITRDEVHPGGRTALRIGCDGAGADHCPSERTAGERKNLLSVRVPRSGCGQYAVRESSASPRRKGVQSG